MKRWIVVVAAMLAMSARARADDAGSIYERRILLSAPIELGYDTTRDAFVWGVRPEAVVAFTWESLDEAARQTGLGVGAYAQVQRVEGDTLVGAGLTFLRYSNHFAFGPSAGLYRLADEDGIAVSLFAGIRVLAGAEHADLPFGIRAEGRFGGSLTASDETSWAITAELDLIVLVGMGIAVLSSIGGD